MSRSTTIGVCAALLIAFGVTAWTAVRGKSATYDEPLHSMAAYVISQYHDFRINPEDPPLWQWWVSLSLSRHELHVDRTHPNFGSSLGVTAARWIWTFTQFYVTPGNDPVAFIMRARTMLILLGVALGGGIAWWSYRLGGHVAAIAATIAFAWDPNFLAHTALVKNDVAISLVGTSLMFATWCAGRRLSWKSALAVILLGAMAMVTKFSGPLLLIVLAICLLIRALLPGEWQIGRKKDHRRTERFAAAVALFLATCLVSYLAIWACYLFRYSPTPDGLLLDFRGILLRTHVHEVVASHPSDTTVTDREISEREAHPALIVRSLVFLNEHRLVPQTWAYGMLFVYRSSLIRDSFLMNRHSFVGFRFYFPLAILFKTPLATLMALFGATLVGLGALWKIRWRLFTAAESPRLWSIACLATPIAVIGYADLKSNLNIGIRHVLPLYPFFYVSLACAAAWVWKSWGRNGRVVLCGLAAGLLVETASAYPDYIPFFNRAAGGSRGGINLLSDSNLDWGQDLPLLAQWQKEHSDRKLYLLYFGEADPGYYGIRYIPLPGYFSHRIDVPTPTAMPTEPGVIAISATFLQGVQLPEKYRPIYQVLREKQEPLEVLGGSIYLYEYNP